MTRELTENEVHQVLADVEMRRQRERERRTLTGEFAPKPGTCRVCAAEVAGEIGFPHDGLIGGPPRQGFIRRWVCQGCHLVYARRPEPAAAKGPK